MNYWIKISKIFSLTLTLLNCGDECLRSLGTKCDKNSWDTGDVIHSNDTFSETQADFLEDQDALEEEVSLCSYPETATPSQINAFKALNEYRNLVGLSCIDENEKINQAAQAHAEYYILHYNQYNSTGLSPHQENPEWEEGFTGVNFWERMSYFGYGSGAWEIIAFENNPAKAVDGWMETLYHRLPIIHPNAKEFGYGNAAKGMIKIDVMDFGKGGSTTKLEYIIYPVNGQENVPKSWDGLESPQPKPPPSGYPSGPMITVHFNLKTGFKIYTHELLDMGGNNIEHMFLAKYGDNTLNIIKDSLLESEIAMYSNFPLKPKTKYSVRLTGVRGSQEFELKWSFTTGY